MQKCYFNVKLNIEQIAEVETTSDQALYQLNKEHP